MVREKQQMIDRGLDRIQQYQPELQLELHASQINSKLFLEVLHEIAWCVEEPNSD
jgi:hypothetical protein